MPVRPRPRFAHVRPLQLEELPAPSSNLSCHGSTVYDRRSAVSNRHVTGLIPFVVLRATLVVKRAVRLTPRSEHCPQDAIGREATAGPPWLGRSREERHGIA